eukprot:INCI5234.2.p1 GENE.INCI5234.2~~INCI5234.2.p1  ORF type:complete len:191 (+),score=30.01 INCI5234.2:168-740(+)
MHVAAPGSPKKTYAKDLKGYDVNSFVEHPIWKHCLFGCSLYTYFEDVWHARKSPRLLVVPYELLLSDFRVQLRRIAAFVGFPNLSEEQLDLVTKRSSRAFMLEHAGQFDDHWIMKRQSQVARSPEHMAAAAKVRPKAAQTRVGALSLRTISALRQEWMAMVSELGLGRGSGGSQYNYNHFVRDVLADSCF